jgi:hypothetical protein
MRILRWLSCIPLGFATGELARLFILVQIWYNPLVQLPLALTPQLWIDICLAGTSAYVSVEFAAEFAPGAKTAVAGAMTVAYVLALGFAIFALFITWDSHLYSLVISRFAAVVTAVASAALVYETEARRLMSPGGDVSSV